MAKTDKSPKKYRKIANRNSSNGCLKMISRFERHIARKSDDEVCEDFTCTSIGKSKGRIHKNEDNGGKSDR